MRLFLWQQLPLLILIQLLEPNRTVHIYAEALLACKSTVGSCRLSSTRVERYPCQWEHHRRVNCNKLNNPGVVSFGRRKAAAIDGDNSVPTLTPFPASDDKKSSQQRVAAIAGGVGAALLVAVIVVLVYLCLMRVKRLIKHNSETASSAPSPPIELLRLGSSPYPGMQSPFDLRQLTILEIEHATSNFSPSNIIGEGAFGLVYKGLLLDGSIVAIKRRVNNPIQNFIHKVNQIAYVQHKHLVKLVGYCEHMNQQLIAYDYVSNGNVGQYLYDSEGLPIGKLDMKQRLLIAIGAAKGLEHLHSLVPQLLHMNFRTRNVLVDENFTAKVSDYGLSKLLTEDHRPASSSSAIDSFRDPELNLSESYSEKSDVYSFGVFLLELISGREANFTSASNLNPNIIMQARESSVSGFIEKTREVDDKEEKGKMSVGKEMMGVALQCIDVSPKRPSMVGVLQFLQHIHNTQFGHFHPLFSEDIGAVTLGSELFQ